MAKITKVVLHFDDGNTHNVDPASASSIFLNEAAAVKCDHHPPYGKPPGSSTTFSALSTTTEGGSTGGSGGTGATPQGETCYEINGVIVCP